MEGALGTWLSSLLWLRLALVTSHDCRCSPRRCSSWMESVVKPSAARILTRRIQDSPIESLSIPMDDFRNMMVARRTACPMILWQNSDKNSRRSTLHLRIHKHAEGERQRFDAWYRCSGDRTIGREELFSQERHVALLKQMIELLAGEGYD